jgi:tRNA threonylcarbamoyladenosine modification (KEOPS) complex Cgi121 subunit
MSMGGQQGYVVNINARSNRGKQHAISAIQQAISQGTSQSVNISMNINDNYGNISDRDIQKAIKDAL